MKFAFLCVVVIVVSCSVCASGDLEIYPGLKLDLDEDGPYRRSLEPDETIYKWPWNPPEPEPDEEEPQAYGIRPQIEQLKHLLEKSRLQRLQQELRYPPHPYDVNFNLENARRVERLNNYRFQSPNTQLLEDVRQYPREDDFTFGEEEEEEDLEEQGAGAHEEAKNKDVGQQVSLFPNAKFAKDPTEFAYPPTDPRFFGKPASTSKVTPDDDSKTNGGILVEHRNEESLPERVKSRDPSAHLRAHQDDNVRVVSVQSAALPASSDSAAVYIIAIVAGISAAATVGLIAVGIGWYNLQKHVKNASDVEYPAYGVTGPNKDASPSGDRRLAQSAQMYHYQHQKQQIIAMESRAAAGERHGSVSEADSDEENEEGDYTVYECPGLAPTGEMEVKNPLFQDDPTPAQTPPVHKSDAGDVKK